MTTKFWKILSNWYLPSMK